MTTPRVHLLNILALTGSGAAAKALLFLVSVVSYKMLSVPDNGLAGFGLTFGPMAALIMDVGLRGYLQRQLARIAGDRQAAHTLLFEAVAVRLLVAIALCPVAVLIAHSMGYVGFHLKIVALFLAYGLFDSVALMLKAALRCYGNMTADAIWSVASKVLLLAILAGAAWTRRFSIELVAWTYAITSALELMAVALSLRYVANVTAVVRPAWAGLKALLLASLPFASMGLLGVLYKSTAVLCLSKAVALRAWLGAISGNAPPNNDYLVGLFTTVVRVPDTLAFFPVSIMGALIPFLAINRDNRLLVTQSFSVLIRHIGALGTAFGAILMFCGQAVILIIAKPEYLVGLPALYWLAGSVPLFFLNYCTANLLICLDSEKAFLKRQCATLALNLALNIALIPKWSVTGAAAALFFSELAALAIDMGLCARRNIGIPWSASLRWAGIAAAIAAAAWLTPDWPPLLRIVPACATAAIGLALTVRRSDLEAIRPKRTA